MENKLIVYLLLTTMIFILLLQALHPAWSANLSTDAFIYYHHASYFLNNFNLTNLSGNEYLPGSILLFISVAAVPLINNSLAGFILGLIFVNVLLIFVTAYIYKRYGQLENITVFALIIFFTGPIIFLDLIYWWFY